MSHSLLRFLSGFAIIILLAFSSNPPNGRTGAPGEGLCTGCHQPGSQNGSVDILGLPATITPGQTYTLTVMSTTTTNSVLAGFQMVGVQDDGTTNAGSMANPSGGSTITVVGSGKSYHEHQPAAGFGGGMTVSWTVDWTAPFTGQNGDITFYVASILANGNSQNSGDRLVTTNVSGSFTSALALMADITSSSSTSCNGAADGSATVEATGGAMPYTFLWTSGETTSTAVMLSAGNQHVRVTDNIGDTVNAQVVIMEPAAIDPHIAIDNNVSCANGSDGQATSSPTGGTSPYSFEWSTGETTNMIINLSAGPLSVTITDINGCNGNQTVQITEPDLLLIDIITQSNVTCNGFNDGSAVVTGVGGTAPYTYNWSTGEMGPTAMNLIPGTNVVTVTDDNGCNNSQDVIISEPDQLVLILVNQTNATCAGGGTDGSATAMAAGGTGSYSYLWSDGQVGPTATNLAPATYTCIVTDDNGCEDILAVTILEPSTILIDLVVTQISAPGANDGSITVLISEGLPPYSILWSNGSTDTTISNLPPNTYSVEVSDANGCSTTATVTISEPGCGLTVNILVVTQVSCPGDSNGVLTIETNNAVSSIIWSRGAITDTISNLSSGMYSVTVTDTASCEATATISIAGMDTELPGFKQDTLCLFIGLDGTAILDSATFYSNVEDNCDENPSALFAELIVDCTDQGITSMAYSLQDASGNIGPVILYLNIKDTVDPIITCAADITVNTCDVIDYPAPVASDNCDSVTVELLSGLGSGNVFPVGTTTETYRAIDENGNESICSFNITVVSDLAVNVATTETTCFDSHDGTALILGTGGTQPYTFSIAPVSDITMLAQGTYYLAFMDSTNCTVLDTFTIEGPGAIDLDSILVTNASAGSFDGSIEIDVIGGSSPYDFFWLRDTSAYSTQEDLFNLFSGYYSLIITDSENCMARFDSIYVDENVANQNLENVSDQFKIFSHQRQIIVQPTTFTGDFDVYLYNGLGQMISVSSALHGELLIDLTDNSAGIYIVHVNIDGKQPISISLIVH